tara:strand:- start:52 stop:975 length:924 start_codon:yes stop_codon:yes gene_type:complete
MINNSIFKIDNEVKFALKNNKPIVALESTLISHGLPYPENIKVANLSIEAVRKNGSIPATIGIIQGKIKIGLNENDLKILAKNKNIHKVTKNNLSLVVSNKLNGATTVGSTINIAAKVGIKFFATGGIGGVHLNYNQDMDVSSDLYELSRNNMCVICSGAKSIIDINKTYEKLESLGIPRLGYKTKYMPGFWYYHTDNMVDYNFTKISELIKYLKINEKIQKSVSTSILLFNPVTKSKAIEKTKINRWVQASMKKANKLSIEGKKLTPFLINEVNKLSKNKTLKTNADLIIKNANLASKVAYNYFLK